MVSKIIEEIREIIQQNKRSVYKGLNYVKAKII